VVGRVLSRTPREVQDAYPPICGQCGERWITLACGPTHAVIKYRMEHGDDGSCVMCGEHHDD
jgi:hypothetical protein